MLRSFAGLIAGLLLAGTTAAANPPGKVTIRWHGQSFFEITTTKGTNIVIDPHAIPEYPRVSMKADLVLMSHLHDGGAPSVVLPSFRDVGYPHGVGPARACAAGQICVRG